MSPLASAFPVGSQRRADFAAGYTSLGQLKNLPVNEPKIDWSFVMTMIEDPGNALIVRSVIEPGAPARTAGRRQKGLAIFAQR